MDLERMRKLAGLDTDTVKAPSQLHEEVVSNSEDVVTETEDVVTEDIDQLSDDVDFTEKEPSTLSMLEEAIEDQSGRLMTLDEDAQEAMKDIEALGLRKVAKVIDMDVPVYNVYESEEGDIWFHSPSEPNTIQETFLTLDEVISFHSAGEDVAMREGAGCTKCEDINLAQQDLIDRHTEKMNGKDVSIERKKEMKIAIDKLKERAKTLKCGSCEKKRI